MCFAFPDGAPLDPLACPLVMSAVIGERARTDGDE
jgi:hypothetical protein